MLVYVNISAYYVAAKCFTLCPTATGLVYHRVVEPSMPVDI